MKSRVYQPAEDSYMFIKQINKTFENKKILDLGTGTGILAIECTKYTPYITAIDINENAIKYTKKEIKNMIKNLNEDISNKKTKKRIENLKKIQIIKSNTFEKIEKEKYDIILYNAPYLPNESNDPDIALDGGKNGYEIPLSTIKKCKKHLLKNGKIITIISSKSKPEYQLKKIKEMDFKIKVKDKKRFFFEELTIIELKLKN